MKKFVIVKSHATINLRIFLIYEYFEWAIQCVRVRSFTFLSNSGVDKGSYSNQWPTSSCIRFRPGTNTLGIIFFCLIFGTMLGTMGRRANVVVQFFAIVDEVVMLLVSRVMW